MYKFLITLLLLVFNLHSYASEADAPFFLRDSFAKAVPGDYVVIEQNRINTLFHVYGKTATTLILEEVSLPVDVRKQQISSWKEWMRGGAEGNISWLMYELDLSRNKETIQCVECYSFSRQGWLDILSADAILPTLLKLPFTPVPEKKRRKIGKASSEGMDFRPKWQPPLTVDGNVVRQATFDAWETHWAEDNTELAGKKIEIYLPSASLIQSEGQNFPTYFPVWLQVTGGLGAAHLRIIDSGKSLTSPKPLFPRHPLEFLDSGRIINGNLQLRLKGSAAYKEFALYASEIPDDESAPPISLTCTATFDSARVITLEVTADVLEKALKPGHKYIFWGAPFGYDETLAKTKQPLTIPQR